MQLVCEDPTAGELSAGWPRMISSIGRRVEFPGQDHGDWAGEGVATNASLIVYADGDPRQVLRSSPAMDRPAARDLVRRLFPEHAIEETGDADLIDVLSPDLGRAYAARAWRSRTTTALAATAPAGSAGHPRRAALPLDLPDRDDQLLRLCRRGRLARRPAAPVVERHLPRPARRSASDRGDRREHR